MQAIFKHIMLINLILISGVFKNFSQDTLIGRPALKVIARAYNDSIKLRWAPIDYQSWRHGIRYGYIIERRTLMKDTIFLKDSKSIKLTTQPLKPLPLKEWEKYVDIDDYVAIAAEAIYGSEFNVQMQQTSPVISVFNTATEQQNRYSFAMFSADCSPLAAKLSGLSFTDYTVKKGEKYIYKIYPAVDLDGYKDTVTIFIGSNEFKPLPKPLIYNITPDEKTITLEWPSDNEGKVYTAYEVYRSEDNGKTFKNLTSKPFINLQQERTYVGTSFFIDTVSETKRYVYKIRGITPFGDKGPYSDTVSAIPRLRVKTIPFIVDYKFTDKGVIIYWDFDKKYEKLLKKFVIIRSQNSTEGFQEISGEILPSQRVYIDTTPLPTAYYKVVAFDKDNMMITSLPYLIQIVDTIPPEIPNIAYAKADSTGKVTLCWYRNKDKDVYGYRIYRGNDINEEFSLITSFPITDTFYIDTINLKTLSPNVYYKIMAIDRRQNHSKLSSPICLKRPDKIPPVSPVLVSLNSNEEGIYVEWIPSTSSDVQKHQIMRKEENKNDWELIYEVKDTMNKYCDKQVKPNVLYKYCIIAVDSSGLKSPISQEISGKYMGNKKSILLSCKIDRAERKIRLIWNNIENAEYYIYRSTGEKPLTLYKKTNSNNYDDTQVNPDVNYKYMVKALSNNKMIISNVEEVRY